MTHNDIHDLFGAIDAQDTPKFLSYLSPDVRFQFGNWPAAIGKDATAEAVDGFFGTIVALSHDLHNIFLVEDHAIARGEVTYTRKDSTQVTLPFTNVYGINDGKIHDYQIYMDINPLYTQG